ncbi:hypothetical protein J6590_000962 [Homalodisca vitripennis]|nr:hypothetical protein J6590_000962 [Homalodisca vitripennis]
MPELRLGEGSVVRSVIVRVSMVRFRMLSIPSVVVWSLSRMILGLGFGGKMLSLGRCYVMTVCDGSVMQEVWDSSGTAVPQVAMIAGVFFTTAIFIMVTLGLCS